MLVWMQGGPLGALFASLGSSLFMALISIIMLGRKLKWKFRPKYLKGSLTFGSWMMTGTIGAIVLNRSQLFVLQNYSDLSMVGILNFGLQLSSVLMLISQSFAKAFQPFIYSATTREIAAVSISKFAKDYISAMMYALLVVFLLSNEIIIVLARPTYASAAPIIRVLAVARFISALNIFPSTAFLLERRVGLMQAVTLGSALFNLILTIVLVNLWQITGAASKPVSFIDCVDIY